MGGPRRFNKVVETRHGPVIVNSGDQYVGRCLEVYGEFSEGEVEVFRQMVRPGDVVVDVGANYGAHTLFLSRAVGETGTVLAFEPQPLIFHALCGTLALNSITNVRAFQQGVGRERGTAFVPDVDYSAPGNFGGISLSSGRTGTPVDVVTIDSLTLRACRMIKADVEGMEEEVLAGAEDTIERLHPILYVENDREQKSLSLMNLLTRLGYHMYWHLPPLYNPANFRANPRDEFPRIVSVNLLCVHRDSNSSISGLTPAIPGVPRPAR